jgi:hypothetical protein
MKNSPLFTGASIGIILDLIAEHQPITSIELAAMLGVKVGSLNRYTASLKNRTLIHRRWCTRPGGASQRVGLWYFGPDPDGDETDVLEPREGRRFPTTWPMNHRRDPLVAALFGPGQAAA